MSEEPLLTWCVVANVVEREDGTGGTKHFSAGTKVWVLPPQWGDGGEDLFVAGRHRDQPGGLVRMVLPRAAAPPTSGTDGQADRPGAAWIR